MKKVILDVDTGIDDALGIMLALGSGRLDVLGITTVSGNVSLEQATENTCKILDLLQAGQDLPVVPGAAKPLLRPAFFEHRVHGSDGIGGALRGVRTARQPEGRSAADYMIEQIRRHPGELTLVMTGPLTNLALAAAQAPDIVRDVREVIVMGGVVQSYGNVTPVAEYNMYVDPEAARIVLNAGFRELVLVGLDVTRKALLSEEHIERLGDTPYGRYVRESTADYMNRYCERNGVRACALHDPLAVGVAIDRKLVTTGHYYVDVETRSELCDGQTVCDFQNRLQREPNAHVCVDVNADAFLDMFIAALRPSHQ